MGKGVCQRMPEKGKTAIRTIVGRLRKLHPNATTELVWSNPRELLVATILAAQCTDERVNVVTATLFEKYSSARSFADADLEVLEQEVRPTGFFRNKAKSIKGACMKIVEDFDGEVPETMDGMLTLPGVARKTANIVLGTACGKNEGIAIDTHVLRVSQRLGLTKQKNPDKIEQDLMPLTPRKNWSSFGHQITLHGRYVCVARKPRCETCPLEDVCEKNL